MLHCLCLSSFARMTFAVFIRRDDAAGLIAMHSYFDSAKILDLRKVDEEDN